MFTFASTFHKAFMKDTSCGSSSVGRALASQAKGHEFESRLPLHYKKGSQTMTICFYIFTRVLLTHFLDILCIR